MLQLRDQLPDSLRSAASVNVLLLYCCRDCTARASSDSGEGSQEGLLCLVEAQEIGHGLIGGVLAFQRTDPFAQIAQLKVARLQQIGRDDVGLLSRFRKLLFQIFDIRLQLARAPGQEFDGARGRLEFLLDLVIDIEGSARVLTISVDLTGSVVSMAMLKASDCRTLVTEIRPTSASMTRRRVTSGGGKGPGFAAQHLVDQGLARSGRPECSVELRVVHQVEGVHEATDQVCATG